MAESGGTIGGDVQPGFEAVADAFRANFADRKELGAACAVVQDGKLVVDLWGGHKDKRRSRCWTEDTLVTMFSTTKGLCAIAMAIAQSRGMFEVDKPVSAYWPEFAQAGKQDITVAQLLAHEAGLAIIDTKLTPEIAGDFDKLGAILAAQEPGWAPGTGHGYHAMTMGWYESQLLSRVDPAGRSIGRFFAEEVAAILDVEFHIGLPATIDMDRIAKTFGGDQFKALLHIRQIPWAILRGFLNPRSETFKAFANPRALSKPGDINKRELLDIELPSVNGTGTARAVAAAYGDLAIGSPRLGVSDAVLKQIEQPVAPSLDRIFGLESAFNSGFMKPFSILPFGSSDRAFGHTGMGGSFGFADPDRRLGYCYAMNQHGYSVPTDPREVALREAVESCAG